jgi:site-specific DNA-methyltransferase (adenine-specific)
MRENEVICGEAAAVLATLPAEAVDLTVTSPPYDGLRDYAGYAVAECDIVRALYAVTAPGGVVVWVVGDATVDGGESGSSFRQALAFMAAGFKLFDTMIYQKTGTSYPSQGRYTQIFEYMFVFAKGRPKTFSPIKDVPKLWEGSWGKTTQRQKDGSLKAGTATNAGKASSGRATDGRYGYKQRTNIWTYANGKRFGHSDELAYKHPATFPEKLAADHILTWSNPGDLVLDPFCGSGTTLKMAAMHGRRWLGIDLSAEYCELSRARVALSVGAQLRLEVGR